MSEALSHRVDHLLIGEPDPFPTTLDARDPPPARPVLAAAPAADAASGDGRTLDPLVSSLDHFVALAGYVLLFLSVFMLGIPALASVALAYAHRRDSHLVVRTHFGFQIRIFWTAALLLLLAAASAVAGGGAVLLRLLSFARDHLPGAAAILPQAQLALLSGAAAAALIAAAVVLFLLAVIWVLTAALAGFLRLLAGRSIGHLPRI